MKICRLLNTGMVISMVLTGCVETIVLDPEEKDLPVMVNCIITPDHAEHTLYLQYVKGKSAHSAIPIENATVYIAAEKYKSSKLDTVYFHHIEGSKWKTSEDPKHMGSRVYSGKECFLTVEIPGREPIRATTSIPKNYPLQIISYPYDPDYDPYSHHFDSNEQYLDNLVYWFRLEHYDKKQIHTPPVWIIATKDKHKKAESRDEHYPYIATDHPLADNSNINGKQLADLWIDEAPDNLLKENWRYYKNLKRLMPNLPLHDDFVRIDHLDTTKYRIIAGPLDKRRTGKQDHFDFLFVSPELDEYLRWAVKNNRNKEHDLTMIYSTENAYSNIEGGVGIFGSYVCDCDYMGI